MAGVRTKLRRISENLWWSWDSQASALWPRVDPLRFARTRGNPTAVLQELEDERYAELDADPSFVADVDEVLARMNAYLEAPGWCVEGAPATHAGGVAYLCMEFGLHSSLRIYSGGLGVLAGDHLRSASDLGVPITGVSLLYRSGYFVQVLDGDQQLAAYPVEDFDRLPIRPALDTDGNPAMISVPIGKRNVHARVMQLAVGRLRLLFLDADIDANHPADRAITSTLYGGGRPRRIAQETLLGVGGIRALQAVGAPHAVVHLNEGHCALSIFELMRPHLKAGKSWEAALSEAKARCVFTTHTPVPAGHDRFNWDEFNGAIAAYRAQLGARKGAFMDLGRVAPGNVHEPLCMTVLALRGSTFANGVSELHGVVSRDMWRELKSSPGPRACPIGHITNGVHPVFWMSDEARSFFDTHAPGWRDNPWNEEFWAEAVQKIDPVALWSLRCTLRQRLVKRVAAKTGVDLDPDAMIIGFARRFATYKRGDLVFSDHARLAALLDKGVQIVFAGKAHPADRHGQAVVTSVLRNATSWRLRGRVAFLPDYDIATGAALTSGTDVWLNNPRRPMEASGTSGQKVPLNGGINLSVLDGWWAEAYDGSNGWAIGDGKDNPGNEAADLADAESLYGILEQQVVPLFYERDAQGVPHAWVRAMKHSIASCIPRYNSHRMVRDYTLSAYEPLASRSEEA